MTAQHEPPGTEIYHSFMDSLEQSDPELLLINQKVWSPTPWVLDVYTDSLGSSKGIGLRKWLEEHLGPESSPIHGMEGRWHFGYVTIYGWIWIGFASEQEMEQFIEAWGSNTRTRNYPTQNSTRKQRLRG